MGDTGLEPVTSALSIRPDDSAMSVYASDGPCLQGFGVSGRYLISRCSASFVGSLWEGAWEANQLGQDRDEILSARASYMPNRLLASGRWKPTP
jgi:hypothetical protein